MEANPFTSPVVVDGVLTDEKVSELLALGTEYAELDFKRTLDPADKRDQVELAKDVAAMQVRGGYIVIGVDEAGAPTGELAHIDLALFDEARLSARLRKWLPDQLTLTTRVLEREGESITVICVAPHPAGYAVLRADGQYPKGNGEVGEVFRAGDMFWREGTSSTRLTQTALEGIIEARVGRAKTDWMAEQRAIRVQERAELEAAYQARDLKTQPLGAVGVDLEVSALRLAMLELLRDGDHIALTHVLKEASARARTVLDRDGDVDVELSELLDKLTCTAAVFLEYDADDWFERVVETLAEVYSMPATEDQARQFGYATRIDTRDRAPLVWLRIAERVQGLGALAVRRDKWRFIRVLTLQHPDRIGDYYENWLRHALTMSARAQHLQERREDGREVELSLLSLSRAVVQRLECLRPDGVQPDDDVIITSLAQFDVLSNIVAIDGAGLADRRGGVFYPNFARFRQARVNPVVAQLIEEPQRRADLLDTLDDAGLATALQLIASLAHSEGIRFDGFEHWQPPVSDFISEHSD